MSGPGDDKESRHRPKTMVPAKPSSRSVPSTVEPAGEGKAVMDLGAMGQVDLSHLSPETRAELQEQYAKGMIDIGLRAKELNVDIQALDVELSSWTDRAAKAKQDGLSVTVSNATETSVGRTEIMIGNSEVAQKGRLSKSQTGEDDWGGPIIITVIIAGALLLAAIFG